MKIHVTCVKRLYAHRAIYACQSKYFEALLYGKFKEGNEKEVILKDIRKDDFALIQSYVYTGELNAPSIDRALDLLEHANKFELNDLNAGLGRYLQMNITLDNVLNFFHCAYLFNSTELCERCLFFIDNHAAKIIASEDLLSLSPEDVLEIFSRDSFFCPEEIIFDAVQRLIGSSETHEANKNKYLKCIRLSALDDDLLHTTVRDSGLFDLTAIMDALRTKRQQQQYVNTLYLYPAENVANANFGAQITTGKNNILSKSCISGNIDPLKGDTWNEMSTGGITIKLPGNYLVRKFRMLLYDVDDRKYRYHIDVSTDNIEWKQIIDKSENDESSWQTLDAGQHYQCAYIRIVCTKCSVGIHLKVVCCEVVPCRPSS